MKKTLAIATLLSLMAVPSFAQSFDPDVGSGNIVHNLHTYSWGQRPRDPYDWAVRFEATAREMMQAGEFAPLIDYEKLGRDAALSIPTPDHYLPLLYVLATGQQRVYSNPVGATYQAVQDTSAFETCATQPPTPT